MKIIDPMKSSQMKSKDLERSFAKANKRIDTLIISLFSKKKSRRTK